uniref:Uncharacterized protein n=1 Tax=Arundo donax TaxID=35708 RepID=A0A0A9BA53_ARUDO
MSDRAIFSLILWSLSACSCRKS